MAESEAVKKWRKENTVYIPIRLQKKTDADILEYLAGAAALDIKRQTAIKYIIRAGIEYEKIKLKKDKNTP